MAAGVLLGLAVPPLASLARPLLIPSLLIPLTLALLRLDWGAIGAYRRRPGVAAALVGRAVADFRAEKRRVVPARQEFAAHPEWSDLLARA